jgi:hypothetical protein
VLLFDLNIDRLRAADQIYRGQLRTVASNAFEIERGARRRHGHRRRAYPGRQGADAGGADLGVL